MGDRANSGSEVTLAIVVWHDGTERFQVFSDSKHAVAWTETLDCRRAIIVETMVVDVPEFGNELNGRGRP